MQCNEIIGQCEHRGDKSTRGFMNSQGAAVSNCNTQKCVKTWPPQCHLESEQGGNTVRHI